MSGRRIGAGGPFLVVPFGGSFTATPFPADIWIVSAVNKRANLNKRIVSRWALGEPAVAVVVVVTRPKAIRMVSLVEFRRPRPKTTIKLFPRSGKATTKTKVVGPLIVKFVSKQRKSFRGKIVLGKPTKVVVVVSPKFRVSLLHISQHIDTRSRPKTKTQFTRSYGKSTTKTKPKAAIYIKFVAQQAVRRARYAPVKIVVGEVPRTFAPTPGVVTEHLYIIMLPHMGQLMNH